MSRAAAVDVAVVGGGVAGLLAARELVGRGREVAVIERGGLKPHSDQLRDGGHALDLATAKANHEGHPDTPDVPFSYEYGVGGNGLHWGGVAPRLLPSDFELRSRHGVGRDWPISYSTLEPFYVAAERALAIAGAPNELFGPSYRPPLPAHPLSPVDQLIAPYLGPYHRLPQARPTRAVAGRQACCGSGSCELCPVDARYSPLHTLSDDLAGRDGFELMDGSVVASVRRDGREWALELVRSDGQRSRMSARRVVLAANGLENPAVLMRSGLGGEEVGLWLGDHPHEQHQVLLKRTARSGEGASIGTGISYAWADGEFRSQRGSQIVYPDNRGPYMGYRLVEALAAGRRGKALQKRLAQRFERTILLDTSGEDLPQRGRRVELSPRRDGLGMPLNRVRYPPDSEYAERGRRVVRKELESRLRPLGARIVGTRRYGGGHLLGTCRMGTDAGSVVDENLGVRGAKGLFCVGGCNFPSYSAHHPTVTVAALAIRLGRHIAET